MSQWASSRLRFPALFACRNAEGAYDALTMLQGRPLGVLLHRYELSNWVLYARAYASGQGSDRRARGIDDALRSAASSLAWLATHWVEPALAKRA